MLRRSSVASGRRSMGRPGRQSHPFMSVQVCPGCQGRNSPQAETCEWCGRPFDGRARGFSLRWWHLATALLFGFVVVALVSLAYLSASRLPTLSDFRPKPAASPVAKVEPTTLPTRAATPGLTLATPKPAASPVPTATPEPPPSPTSAPARYVRVANTSGLGVFLREEPGAQSARIQPAVAEGALLRLVGPEQTVQAQIWRLCEHEGRGAQGWVPAQYLQSVDITPTPGRQ
jgi:hypothetical protein